MSDSGYRNHDLLSDRLSGGAVSSLSELGRNFSFLAALTGDVMRDVRYALELLQNSPFLPVHKRLWQIRITVGLVRVIRGSVITSTKKRSTKFTN